MDKAKEGKDGGLGGGEWVGQGGSEGKMETTVLEQQ